MVAAVKVLLQLGQIPASTPGDKAAHSSCCLCMWTIKSSLVPADLHLIPSSRHSNNKFECSDSGPADYFLYRDRLASLTCLTNIISTYLIDLTDRLQPVTIAYRTTTAKARFRQLSPRVAHHRTPKNGNARSFGLLAFQTPRLPRFTFCATAEIET